MSNRSLPVAEIPDSWAKVNFSQFLRVKPGMPVVELLSILLEKTAQEVESMKLDLAQAFKTLSFLDSKVEQSVSPHAPKNLEQETIGQFEDVRLYAKQMKGDVDDFKHYPVIYATYMFHVESLDVHLVEKIEQQIPSVELLPCGLVIGTVQHYLKEMERIDEYWGKLFPKDGYTGEQQAAGFPQIDEFFGHFGALVHAEKNSKWSRDEWSCRTVTEFKYFMLYLSKVGEAQKKYSEAEAAKIRAKTAKRR